MTTSPDKAPVGFGAASAALVSGGLDSAILVADRARDGAPVTPLYVRGGLAWESVELGHLRRFLAAIAATHPSVRPLVVLEQPLADLYGPHWSLTGQGVPAAGTPDEAVYLPGRNLLLLLKALLWCHLNDVPTLALGVLASNPFPDASSAFFAAYAAAIGQGVNDPRLRVACPYAGLRKADVMRRGAGLPLGLTFSCIRLTPTGLHCGVCNKCAERRAAFAAVGWPDPTKYASE